VRDDGWMGAALTLRRPLELRPGIPLRLRYGLWVHGDLRPAEQVEAIWQAFCQLPRLQSLSPVRPKK